MKKTILIMAFSLIFFSPVFALNNLVDGRTYTISQLINRSEQSNQVVINTEGYVIGINKCSDYEIKNMIVGCGPEGMLTVSQESSGGKYLISIIQDYQNPIDVNNIEIGKKYKFVIKTGGDSGNSLILVSFQAAENFIQTTFDQDLTDYESGNCWSMNIKPNVQIPCALSVNKDAYYYYEGKKGEKITVTVSAKNFVPEIDISDANGDMEFFDNKQKQNFLTIIKTLPYTGKYTIEIKTRYHTETKEGEPFTIHLTSNQSNVQADIRKDNLVADKKYSVYELLNFNQSTVARNFLIDAYVSDIYKNRPCPPDAYSCPISLPPNITISDCYGDCPDTRSYTTLWLGAKNKLSFAIGKHYQFEVSVVNNSNTNIPQNKFSLVSVKNLDGTPVPTSTSAMSTDNQETSVFLKTWEWFISIFK